MRHTCLFTIYKVFHFFGNRNERVVRYFKTPRNKIESQIDFLFLPTTNLSEAFITNFLADQNVMTYVGGDLTFYFRNKTFDGPSLWNISLN